MVLSRFPKLSSNLPLINFVIAGTALGFQVGVLYPWHHEIDKSHHVLAEKVENLATNNKPSVSHDPLAVIASNAAASGAAVVNTKPVLQVPQPSMVLTSPGGSGAAGAGVVVVPSTLKPSL